MNRPPVVGRPMHEFFEAGWLHEINRALANPHGVHLGLELNDDGGDDGTLVHGWHCVPLAHAHLVLPSLAMRIERMRAFERHIAEVLAG